MTDDISSPMLLGSPETEARVSFQAASAWKSDLASRQVAAMLSGYRSTGGVASGEIIASLLRQHSEQPISLLARWIVSRKVVSFVWRSQTHLPLFQFDLNRMEIRPGAQSVMAELARAFDDWEMANWFALPNSWLAGAVPADALASDSQAVLHAARADRFVAIG